MAYEQQEARLYLYEAEEGEPEYAAPVVIGDPPAIGVTVYEVE